MSRNSIDCYFTDIKKHLSQFGDIKWQKFKSKIKKKCETKKYKRGSLRINHIRKKNVLFS